MNRWMTTTLLIVALAGCSSQVICPQGQQACGDTCKALQLDTANCGACGHACGAGEICSAGTCSLCAASCSSARGCVNEVCLPDVALACFNSGQVQGATKALLADGAPLTTDAGPVALAPLGAQLWAANSLSNTLSAVHLDPPASATSGASALKLFVNKTASFNDLEAIASDGRLLYVTNGAVNTLVVVDPAVGVIDEVPVGSGFDFPQGVTVAGGRAYVSLNGGNAVAVVDVSAEVGCLPPNPSAPLCGAGGACSGTDTCVDGRCQRALCGKVLKRVDVSALASAGGQAMPARSLAHNGKLYVTLNNLDFTFKPAGNGRLAVIDLGTLLPDATTPFLDLGASCLNPADLALSGTTLWVTCGFQDFFGTGAITGAAFVPVNLSGTVPVPGAATAVTGVAPGSLAFCGGLGFAGDRAFGKLIRLDPTSGAAGVSPQVLCPPNATGASLVGGVACAY